MRIITFISLLLFLALVGCNQSPGSEKTESVESHELEIAEENLLTVDFEVHGMTCTGCEKAVSASIGNLDGIKSVNASHIDSNTVVSFDKTKTDPDKIMEAIQSAGYEVMAFTEKDKSD